jgi:hypothetical protein
MVLVMFASTNTDDPAIALWVNTVWLYASSKNQPLLVLAGRVISLLSILSLLVACCVGIYHFADSRVGTISRFLGMLVTMF